MALEEYRRKRDFGKTAEPPPGAIKARKGELSYLIQKHDATRLHYDFRLELNGVLLSWAVTKGPSLDPADKRLAVRAEDHPLPASTQSACRGSTRSLATPPLRKCVKSSTVARS